LLRLLYCRHYFDPSIQSISKHRIHDHAPMILLEPTWPHNRSGGGGCSQYRDNVLLFSG